MNIRNGILTIASFVSAILFPWPLTIVLTFVTSFFEPLVPVAVGLFADTLYYAPSSGSWPIATLSGLAVSIIAALVRYQLQTSPMR
ncbi:MAG: hypothetical protein PHV99_01040 [Candidatus Pacebacteria bacterium]|nr:hypothetical protein [Candidatus Paceibacterota bacterium]